MNGLQMANPKMLKEQNTDYTQYKKDCFCFILACNIRQRIKFFTFNVTWIKIDSQNWNYTYICFLKNCVKRIQDV